LFRIKKIRYRKILNSHVNFTNEFIIELEDGSIGIGASSQGETISIYEDKKVSFDPEIIIKTLEAENLLGKPLDQELFDSFLSEHRIEFGQNNAYGLSEALFNATVSKQTLIELFHKPRSKLTAPLLCLNILNGGWHAYTNPVLSDFSEFMLVSKGNDLEEVIAEHNEIQKVVKEKQLKQTKTVVSGNPVNSFPTRDNREVIEFLLNILVGLGLSKKYDLMIDASAGDLWNGTAYCLGVTDNSMHSPDDFVKYWLRMIQQYKLMFLEDPFHEKDFDRWMELTAASDLSCIIGDNLYSSDVKRISEGAAMKYSHAAVIKPNQAGTVTAVKEAIEAGEKFGQIVITSHRSISTESTFLSKLTCIFGIKYIKIGPLATDYSSVVRLNEIIRLTEEINES
jgi:enolase